MHSSLRTARRRSKASKTLIHQYCEPGANREQTKANLWFWSQWSHSDTTSEGAGDPNNAEADVFDPRQQLLHFVWQGENKVVPKSEHDAAWKWEGAEKYPDFQSLMDAVAAAADGDGDVNAQGAPLSPLRSFHPKATAYREHTTLFFAAMADNREATSTGRGHDPGQNEPEQGLKCFGTGNNDFLGRDDMIHKVQKFCSEAAAQGVQDKDSGSIMCKYNQDTRFEVDVSIDWPPGTDIKENMEAKCVKKMITITDSKLSSMSAG